MEDSQRKLNAGISTMAGTLHRNYLRRIYYPHRYKHSSRAEAFKCSFDCTEDPKLDPLKFNECVARCSSKITAAEQAMSQEMESVQERLMTCIRSCEKKSKDSNDKDSNHLQTGFESCVVNCANDIQQLLPKLESHISDQLKTL